jgi:uncharacterized glyoxalase superfamily protein PhnB
MEQRLSLVTLGVSDVNRAGAFYKALGWTTKSGEASATTELEDMTEEEADVIFFQAGPMVVALWGRETLAEDSAVEDSGGWGGITLAYNARSPEEVDSVIEEARAAGAKIGREPDKTFWGGYSGVFIDPDGHPWEVAHNPRWTVHDDGSTTLD